ncbi:DUF2238 domain-containing protein [Azotobacter sp. CWF10]
MSMPPRQLYLMFGLLAPVWLWAAIDPLSRADWLLENLLVFFFGGLLLATHRRFAFSPGAYWLFALFLALHLYGAHYTYAETPLGNWLRDTFRLGRNHYDRLVHLAFGLLLACPLRELLERRAGLHGFWLDGLTLCLVMAISGLYEQLEMLATLIVSPELGMAFLGTQGDEWDAQKDSALATLGAVGALGLRRLFGRSRGTIA